MKKAIYIGIFLNDASVDKLERHSNGTHLCNKIRNQHVTLMFRPTTADIEEISDWIGQEATMLVTGYGKDENNEGYSVELSPFLSTFCWSKVPHITTYISEKGRPVDTGMLEFREFDKEEQFCVRGDIGIFYDTGISFEIEN